MGAARPLRGPGGRGCTLRHNSPPLAVRVVAALLLSACLQDLAPGSLRYSAHAAGVPLSTRAASQRAALLRQRALAARSAAAKVSGMATSDKPEVPRTTADHSLSLPNWCSAGPYADDDELLFTSMTRRSAASRAAPQQALAGAHAS
jgi:hypothetical protein